MLTPTNSHLRIPVWSGKLLRIALIATAAFNSAVYSQTSASLLSRDDVQRALVVYQQASQRADPPMMEAIPAGRIWSELGSLYEHTGKYDDSDAAYRHALRLLRDTPGGEPDLARAMDGLGSLCAMRGDLRKAERLEKRALGIREESGNIAEMRQSWNHLAALYVRKRRPKLANEYAGRTLDRLDASDPSSADERIYALLVRALSQSQLHEYSDAISTVEISEKVIGTADRSGSFEAGFVAFLHGYICWKSGDIAPAGALMEHGVDIVRRQLGWEHPVYLRMVDQYARFLRSRSGKKAAQQQQPGKTRPQSEPGCGREALDVPFPSR